MNKTGKLIRQRRLEKFLTQNELGHRVGLHGQSVYKIEAGDMPPKKYITAIADVLAIKMTTMEQALKDDYIYRLRKHY